MATDDLSWRKSSFSGEGNCVEVADLPNGGRAVRDTKNKGRGPALTFTPAEWQAFVSGVKNNEFDV